MDRTLDEMQYRQQEIAKRRVKLFNPDDQDFTVKWHGEPVTIHALEIEEFDYHLAQHVKKHLVRYLLGKAGKIQATADDIEKIESKVEVKL